MMASCRNVETYAAAQVGSFAALHSFYLNCCQVFYWVGFNGMAYVLDVFSILSIQIDLRNECAN
jgi:hypothetical protein